MFFGHKNKLEISNNEIYGSIMQKFNKILEVTHESQNQSEENRQNISYALREKCVVLSACILQIINGWGI